MKNVTIALDDALIRQVRRIAAERDTSMNGLIREFLVDLARSESRAARARRRIRRLSQASTAEIGPRTWGREELYEP